MEKFDKIVLNIPHSSALLPCESGWGDLLGVSREIRKWTDWHTSILFNPNRSLKRRVIPVVFQYSRFFVDVERLIDDALNDKGQGIVYTEFNGIKRNLTDEDKKMLMNIYSRHIHTLYLNMLSSAFSKDCLLIDCHSFPSELSDVDICIGYNEDESKPDDEVIEFIKGKFERNEYKVRINEPYSNSLTPRKPINYKSVMIEVNKRCYMDERTLELNTDYYKIGNIINSVYLGLLK